MKAINKRKKGSSWEWDLTTNEGTLVEAFWGEEWDMKRRLDYYEAGERREAILAALVAKFGEQYPLPTASKEWTKAGIEVEKMCWSFNPIPGERVTLELVLGTKMTWSYRTKGTVESSDGMRMTGGEWVTATSEEKYVFPSFHKASGGPFSRWGEYSSEKIESGLNAMLNA